MKSNKKRTQELAGISNNSKPVRYSAVVLDGDSQKKIVYLLLDPTYAGWEMFAHHMTIKMGELPENLKDQIGNEVELKVVALGVSDKAVAAKVEGFFTTNKIPHITLAVNREAGGKPVMSNDIVNWNEIALPFTVKGRIEEVR